MSNISPITSLGGEAIKRRKNFLSFSKKSGNLFKKERKFLKKWVPQFFVLENQRLLYFHSEESSIPAGIYQLKGVKLIGPFPSPESDMFCFELSGGSLKNILHLAASTRSEAMEWIEELKHSASLEFGLQQQMNVVKQSKEHSKQITEDIANPLTGELFKFMHEHDDSKWKLENPNALGGNAKIWIENREFRTKGFFWDFVSVYNQNPQKTDFFLSAFFIFLFSMLNWLKYMSISAAVCLLSIQCLHRFFKISRSKKSIWCFSERKPSLLLFFLGLIVAVFFSFSSIVIFSSIMLTLQLYISTLNVFPISEDVSHFFITPWRKSSFIVNHSSNTIAKLLTNASFRHLWDSSFEVPDSWNQGWEGEKDIYSDSKEFFVLEAQSDYISTKRELFESKCVTVMQQPNNFVLVEDHTSEFKLNPEQRNKARSIRSENKSMFGFLIPLNFNLKCGIEVMPLKGNKNASVISVISQCDYRNMGLWGAVANQVFKNLKPVENWFGIVSFFKMATAKEIMLVKQCRSLNSLDFNSKDKRRSEIEARRKRYLKIAEQKIDEWLNILKRSEEEEKDWVKYGKIKGIEVFKKPNPNSSIPMVRGFGSVHCKPFEFMAVLMSLECVSGYDKNFDDAYVLQEIAHDMKVYYVRYKPIGPTSPRDIVALSSWKKLPNESFIAVSCSVEHPDAPQNPNYVRAQIYSDAWLISPHENDPTMANVLCQTVVNPSGMIPSFLVNMLSVDIPLIIHEMDTFIQAKIDFSTFDTSEFTNENPEKLELQRIPETECNEEEQKGKSVSCKRDEKKVDNSKKEEGDLEGKTVDVNDKFVLLRNEKYMNIIKPVFNELMKASDPAFDHEWKFKSEKYGNKLYTYEKPTSLPIVKVTGKIDRDPSEVFAFYCDLSKKQLYNEGFDTSRIVEDTSDHVKVIYSRFHKPAPMITPRDFCFVTCWAADEKSGTLYMMSHSIKHTDCPEIESHVRAFMGISGFAVRPFYEGGKKKSEVIFLAQMDFMGNVPSFVINFAMMKQPLVMISKLRELLEGVKMDFAYDPLLFKFYPEYDICRLIRAERSDCSDVEEKEELKSDDNVNMNDGMEEKYNFVSASESNGALNESEEKDETESEAIKNVNTQFAIPDLKKIFEKEKYINILKPVFDMIMKAADRNYDNEWQLKSEKYGNKLYTYEKPTSLPIIKVIGKIDRDPSEVFAFYCDLSKKGLYNEGFDTSRIVEDASDHVKVIYSRFHKPAPMITPRDFCFAIAWAVDERDGTIYNVGYSVEHPDCPEIDSHVRAFLGLSGFAVRPFYEGGKKKSEVIFLAQMDFMGNVPSFVINFAMMKQPLVMISKLRELLEGVKMDFAYDPLLFKFYPEYDICRLIRAERNDYSDVEEKEELKSDDNVNMNEGMEEKCNFESGSESNGVLNESENCLKEQLKRRIAYTKCAKEVERFLWKSSKKPMSKDWIFELEYKDVAVFRKTASVIPKNIREILNAFKLSIVGTAKQKKCENEDRNLNCKNKSVYQREAPRKSLSSIKSFCIINAMAEDIHSIISDCTRRNWYDEMVDEIFTIEKLSPNLEVLYLRIKPPKPILLSQYHRFVMKNKNDNLQQLNVKAKKTKSLQNFDVLNRDRSFSTKKGDTKCDDSLYIEFILLSRWCRLDDGTFIHTMQSIEHPDYYDSDDKDNDDGDELLNENKAHRRGKSDEVSEEWIRMNSRKKYFSVENGGINGCIRGKIILEGWIIKKHPLNDRLSEVFYLFNMEALGPHNGRNEKDKHFAFNWAENLIYKKMPLNLLNLRKLFPDK